MVPETRAFTYEMVVRFYVLGLDDCSRKEIVSLRILHFQLLSHEESVYVNTLTPCTVIINAMKHKIPAVVECILSSIYFPCLT
jgi:hypothetical protein